MSQIEKLIPTAIQAVTHCKIVDKDGVPSEFNGYISSFGAAMINSGLLPSIIFYSQGGASNERQKVILGIEYILKKHHESLLYKSSLVSTVADMVEKKSPMSWFEEKVTEAAIALKLAIRTFPKSKRTENEYVV